MTKGENTESGCAWSCNKSKPKFDLNDIKRQRPLVDEVLLGDILLNPGDPHDLVVLELIAHFSGSRALTNFLEKRKKLETEVLAG